MRIYQTTSTHYRFHPQGKLLHSFLNIP